jgi:hypothetical protein
MILEIGQMWVNFSSDGPDVRHTLGWCVSFVLISFENRCTIWTLLCYACLCRIDQKIKYKVRGEGT